MKWRHRKKIEPVTGNISHAFFPLLLINVHLKQNETFKNKASSYRTDRNWRIFTEALKYVSLNHSYKKQLLVFYSYVDLFV